MIFVSTNSGTPTVLTTGSSHLVAIQKITSIDELDFRIIILLHQMNVEIRYSTLEDRNIDFRNFQDIITNEKIKS